jgi:hypothetical protein
MSDVTKVMQGLPVVTGGVLVDLVGTAALPTSASAATTGFTALGFVADSGLTESRSRTTDKTKAWGGSVVKVAQTEYSETYQFTLYETLNSDVQKVVNGDSNVTITAATASTGTLMSIKRNKDVLPKLQWIFDMKDGDAKDRLVVPLGQITAIGDVVYSDSGVKGYPVTVEAYEDASGNCSYEYTDDGVFA